jgi:hypothetical protein
MRDQPPAEIMVLPIHSILSYFPISLAGTDQKSVQLTSRVQSPNAMLLVSIGG